MFPALVNCCTIDWFREWPAEALSSVATSFFQVSNVDCCLHAIGLAVYIKASDLHSGWSRDLLKICKALIYAYCLINTAAPGQLSVCQGEPDFCISMSKLRVATFGLFVRLCVLLLAGCASQQ